MAMSFARPDPSSPASVADAVFGTGRRGFDQGEVRDFLRMVAAELGRLQERERFLERELRSAHTNPDLQSVELDDNTVTRLLGEETARVLTTARDSAAEIRQKAEQSAAQLVNGAADEAARLREEAETEASRRRSDAAADAESELAMAKQQGREMVNEARAYRERVLSELARRRELAREQIEQLLHGRDRLIQAFEAARLSATDVIAELQPLGEPDEYVNLSPTTGPVPVMVPNSPRPEPVAEPDAPAAVEADIWPETVEVADESAAAEPDAEAAVDAEPEVEAPLGVEPEPDGDVGTVEAVGEEAEPDAGVGTVEAADGVEPEPDAGVEVEEPTDGEASAEDDRDDRDDDVVVDLFARLRADTTAVDSTEVVEHAPVDEAPVDSAEVVEHAPVDEAPVDEAPIDEAPIDEAPVVEHAPVDEAPVDEDAADGDAADGGTAERSSFDERAVELTPLIVSSAKKIKRVLADEQNEVLDTLRRRDPVRDLDTLLPSRAEHLARYRVCIVDDLLAAAHAGASSLTTGRVARLAKADVIAAAAAAEAVLDEWLIVPLRERLERCVADGGGDNAAVARRARSVYREWKTQHIDELLDDVIVTAHGRGAFAMIEAGTPVLWVADSSSTVCVDCDDNTLSAAVPAGDEFPTGHVCTPAHLGCRCLLVPAER